MAIPVSDWPTDRGRPFGRVPTSVHPGPASFRVETFDDSGVTQQATVAVNIGSAPEPPELLCVSSPYATGSAPGTEIDVSYFNASGGDIAEFRQGTFVKEVSVSPAVGAGALAARIGLPDALTGGNVSIRIRSTVNGIPTGWSNAVVFEVKDRPGAANRPRVEPNRFAIAGKRAEINMWPPLDGGYPEYRLQGPGGDYTIVGRPRGSYYASGYALWPSEIPPGGYFVQGRYELPQMSNEYSDADYVEVLAPEQNSGLSFSPTGGEFIEIPLGSFKFPYGAGLFDRLVISPSGTVSLGPARLDLNYYPWVDKLFDGTPRIAPFWSSGLQLEKSGAVTYSRSSTSFVVSFQDVPDYHNQLHNFSLELFPDGRFETRYGAMPSDTAGLVGYSLPGNVSLVAETDLQPLSVDVNDVSPAKLNLEARPRPVGRVLFRFRFGWAQADFQTGRPVWDPESGQGTLSACDRLDDIRGKRPRAGCSLDRGYGLLLVLRSRNSRARG